MDHLLPLSLAFLPPFCRVSPPHLLLQQVQLGRKWPYLGGGNHKSQGGAACVLHHNTSPLCSWRPVFSREKRPELLREGAPQTRGPPHPAGPPLLAHGDPLLPQPQALHLPAPHLARPPIHRLLFKLLSNLKTDLRCSNCGGGLDVEGGSLLLDLHGWFGGRSHRDLPKHHVDRWKKMASEVSQSQGTPGETWPP